MSELRAYKADVTIPVYGTIADAQVYLKSEADKVIAELKKEKEYVVEQTAEVINGQEREIQHHKYKRCLAMAKWCACERDIYNLTPKVAREEHYCKWHKRWLAIAEKFKEAK